MKEQIEHIIDLMTKFDEMGFVPTTTVPCSPEAYAIKWRDAMAKALIDLQKQIDTPTLMPTQTNSAIYELEKIEEMAEIMRHSCERECECNKYGKIDCEYCEAQLLYKAGFRKQREGEWLPNPGGGWLCGNCKKYSSGLRNYCPECGAKMKGADDG